MGILFQIEDFNLRIECELADLNALTRQIQIQIVKLQTGLKTSTR